MGVEEEAREFWRNKEREKGGPVSLYTFAIFIGRSEDRILNLSGLLYTVESKLYFEDFEKENWLMKIMNRKSAYEKTEFFVSTGDITGTRIVSRNSAMNCVEGFVGVQETKVLGNALRFFSKPILQINLRNGTALFFDVMKLGEMQKALQG